MYLKTAIALLMSAALGADAGSDADTFNSYTVAYKAAADVKRPMLVVLNPPADEVSTQKSISVDDLRQDTEIDTLLENYVVAEIDTGTEHGKKVHELFGSKPLPRVVVIDSDQKLQIFRTSNRLDDTEIKDVLEKYQDGKRISTSLDWTRRYNIPGDCPNCRKF
mgnify:CR=1 FL=1